MDVRILRPRGGRDPLPVIVYIHGAGWVFGNEHTHDRLIRELAVGTQAAVVYPKYSLSPEARYPVAIEQNYAVAKWVADHSAEMDLDSSRIAIAGDSVDGNMTAAVTLLAKEHGGPDFRQQVLFYPVTDANSPVKPTCCVTRARPTRPGCAKPESRSPRCALSE